MSIDYDAVQKDEDHREFMLAMLRVASARCKLMDYEIMALGVSLKTHMIEPQAAVKWLFDMNLMSLIEPLPGNATALLKEEPKEQIIGKNHPHT